MSDLQYHNDTTHAELEERLQVAETMIDALCQENRELRDRLTVADARIAELEAHHAAPEPEPEPEAEAELEPEPEAVAADDEPDIQETPPSPDHPLFRRMRRAE
jgi:septal ring factor EnvC (AmiA/AmiB activator)